jgi:hypothetical protein
MALSLQRCDTQPPRFSPIPQSQHTQRAYQPSSNSRIVEIVEIGDDLGGKANNEREFFFCV